MRPGKCTEMKDIRVAAVISRSPALQIARNLEKTLSQARAAAGQGADIVCFPEMNLSGYCNTEEIRTVAETVPGPLSEKLAELAGELDIAILAGMAEKEGKDRIYASHLVVKPSGEVSCYRKLHIAPPEKEFFVPGNALPLFESKGIRFGIQLCYDAHFPELSSLMARKGADLIFFPHASPRGSAAEKYRSWMRHLPARAYDNSLFVVACNQTGEKSGKVRFPGIAMAIDPSGNIIKKDLSDEEGVMIADLKAESLERVRGHKMRFFLPNRRPELYKRLRESS